MAISEITYSDYIEVIAYELCDAVGRYYEAWEGVLMLEAPERDLLTKRIEQKRLSVVLLSAALTETAGNFVLSLKENPADFQKLEGERFFDKWAKLPKRYYPSYALTTELSCDLKALIGKRNSIVHSKPQLSVNGTIFHVGNEGVIKLDEHEFMRSCATLAFRLVDNLSISAGSEAIWYLSLRTICGAVLRNVNSGDARVAQYMDLPEALVCEIASQGFARPVARMYASMIKTHPDVDVDGNIVIKRRGAPTVLLKPLKYFQSQ